MHGVHSLGAEGTKRTKTSRPKGRQLEVGAQGNINWKNTRSVLGRENTKIASILRREIPGESKGFVLLSASLPPPVLSWPLMATGASLLSRHNFPSQLALYFWRYRFLLKTTKQTHDRNNEHVLFNTVDPAIAISSQMYSHFSRISNARLDHLKTT